MFEVERQSTMKLAAGLMLVSVVLKELELQIALVLTLCSSCSPCCSSANKSDSYFSKSHMGLRSHVSKCCQSAGNCHRFPEVQGYFSASYKGHKNALELAGLSYAASKVQCA
jgi:hypothetical protein